MLNSGRNGRPPRPNFIANSQVSAYLNQSLNLVIPPDYMTVENGIQPVIDLDKMMGVVDFVGSTISGNGNGTIILETVPEGEYWEMYAFGLSATNCDLTNFNLVHRDGRYIWLDIFTNQTAIGEVFGVPVPMMEGWRLESEVANDAGADSVWGSFLVRKWKI